MTWAPKANPRHHHEGGTWALKANPRAMEVEGEGALSPLEVVDLRMAVVGMAAPLMLGTQAPVEVLIPGLMAETVPRRRAVRRRRCPTYLFSFYWPGSASER